jgi:hypothetical protein
MLVRLVGLKVRNEVFSGPNADNSCRSYQVQDRRGDLKYHEPERGRITLGYFSFHLGPCAGRVIRRHRHLTHQSIDLVDTLFITYCRHIICRILHYITTRSLHVSTPNDLGHRRPSRLRIRLSISATHIHNLLLQRSDLSFREGGTFVDRHIEAYPQTYLYRHWLRSESTTSVY